jgi:hypothetical protein
MAEGPKLPGPPVPPQWDLPALEELRVARARVRLGDEDGRIVLFRSPLQAVREAVEEERRLRGIVAQSLGAEPGEGLAEYRTIALAHVRRLLDSMPEVRRRVLVARAKGASYRALRTAIGINREDLVAWVTYGLRQVQDLIGRNGLDVLELYDDA